MDYSSMAGHAYHSEAAGAHDSDYRVYGGNLRVIMEADIASYARTIQEREVELRDLYLESSPRRRTARQQQHIERLKEEIQQLHDEVMALQTNLADSCSYTPSSPSYLPGHDDPFDAYDDSELDDEDDYVHDEWEDHYDPEMDLWSSESPGGMGFELEGEGMSTRRDVSDDELENLPTLMCFGIRIVGADKEGPEDTTTSKLITPQSTRRRVPVPTRSSSRHIPQSYSDETPVEEVRRKMRRAAVPGQDEVLAHVKYLVTLAYRTPTHLRTDAQKVLLFEWRRPPPSPPPVVDVHAYVDASGSHGIGFHFRGQWQSWRLKQCWWIDKDANIQWAEAVAIELGLRLLIKAGFAAQRIMMYSDNIGAVDALQRGNTRLLHVGLVVKRILSLCETYQLDLSVAWVPGVENPADAPSRFHMRDGGQRFPWDIDIPHHLRRFVAPYYLSTSAVQI